MAESAEHHLEHAQHAQHAAHDPLDRKVAMTMAIFAAVLAAAAMISHRGHTQTLKLTTEANIHHTKANTGHTKASDMWNYYQAKNILSREYQILDQLVEVMQVKPDLEAKRQETNAYLRGQIEKYEGTKSKPGALADLKHKAEILVEEAEQNEQRAEANEEVSHAVHHSVNWIDYGHLGLELALVLSTITVLTKQRGFWYTGIAAAFIGLGLVVVGVLGLLQHGNL